MLQIHFPVIQQCPTWDCILQYLCPQVKWHMSPLVTAAVCLVAMQMSISIAHVKKMMVHLHNVTPPSCKRIMRKVSELVWKKKSPKFYSYMKKARCRISLQYAKFCVKNVKNEYFYCHLFKTKNILEVYTQNNKKKAATY